MFGIPSCASSEIFKIDCGVRTPSALKISDCSMPEAVAVTVFVPAIGPNVSSLFARPFESVVALVTVSVPPPAMTAKVTWTFCKGLSN